MKAFTVFAALPALFLSWSASAQTYLTYQFTANCQDCQPADTPSVATLVLKDYQPGTALSGANLVSFTYGSNIESWDSSQWHTYNFQLSGVLGTTPGAYEVNYAQNTDNEDMAFTTGTNGLFNLAIGPGGAVGGGVDHGNLGVWALVSGGAVPEAATWTTMIAGFGMVGAALRRRRIAFAA